jgi:glycosyltransferase involved in cell wall biosynthesis
MNAKYRTLRIIQITDTLRSGGKERQIVELLKWLSRIPEIDSELIVMHNDIHYSYLYDLSIPVHSLIRKGRRDFSVFYTLMRLLRIRQPDIIHSWNSMCSIYALPITKLFSIKFVNGFLRNAPPTFSYINRDWLRAKLTFPFSDIIASNSYAGLKSYAVPKRKAVCLHNGFDFNRIKGIESKRSIRNQIGIPTNKVVGMVATFSKNKDYANFIKTAKMIIDERDDVTFVTIGDGENFKYISQMIDSKYKTRIISLGKKKHVLNYINTFDIGVLATNALIHGEGISNVVMEYMALKKPTIVTACGGNYELVDDGYTGFLIQDKNPYQMKNYISLLLDNAILAKRMGENGYNKLKQEYSIEKMGNTFLRLYRSLAY